MNKSDTKEEEVEEDEDEDVCDICKTGDSAEDNPIIFCDLCSVAVHKVCYSVDKIPEGQWFCYPCVGGFQPSSLKCEVCSYTGGAYKRTVDNKWVHGLCFEWMVETNEVDTNEVKGPLVDLSLLFKDRYRLKCTVCANKKRGACIQCCHGKCTLAVHPQCLYTENNTFSWRVIVDLEDDADTMREIYCKKHYNDAFNPLGKLGLVVIDQSKNSGKINTGSSINKEKNSSSMTETNKRKRDENPQKTLKTQNSINYQNSTEDDDMSDDIFDDMTPMEVDNIMEKSENEKNKNLKKTMENTSNTEILDKMDSKITEISEKIDEKVKIMKSFQNQVQKLNNAYEEQKDFFTVQHEINLKQQETLECQNSTITELEEAVKGSKETQQNELITRLVRENEGLKERITQLEYGSLRKEERLNENQEKIETLIYNLKTVTSDLNMLVQERERKKAKKRSKKEKKEGEDVSVSV